jgi:hypothetical protein
MRNTQSHVARLLSRTRSRCARGTAPAFGFARAPGVAIVLALALVLSTALSGSAAAGRVGIQFDISSSSVSILGGTIEIPPDGFLSVSDRMRIVAPATSPTGVYSGAAILRRLDFDLLSIDKNLGSGAAHVTGSVAVDQIGEATGSLLLNGADATLSLSTLPSVGLHVAIAPNLHCVGTACTQIASFPITNPVTPLLVGTLNIANIGQSGLASFDQTFGLTLSGVTAVVRLVGHEVVRTFVPEPSSAMLIGFGIIGAGLIGRGAVGAQSRRQS